MTSTFLRPRLPVLLPRNPMTALVVVAFALAIVPVLLTTLVFGGAIRSSEREKIDARLVAALTDVRLEIQQEDRRAAAAAGAVARIRAVQVALERRDRGTLRRFESRHGGIALAIALPGDVVPRHPVAAVTERVTVRSAGSVIGRVYATVSVPHVVARTAARHGFVVLRADRTSAPIGVPSSVTVSHRPYRALRAVVAPRSTAVVAVPAAAISRATHRRQLVIGGAGLLTVIGLAIGAGLLLRIPGSDAGTLRRLRPDRRSPVSLVGDVAAAAHDPRALLPILLETVVMATNASGGHVDWHGRRVATIGEPLRRGEEVPFSLSVGHGVEGAPRIVLYAPRGGFSAGSRSVAEALVAQGQIALENAHLQTVVRRQAVTDELTDLANRRRFMEVLQREIARASRFDTPLALVLFDLDHFKQINDQHGHQVGDEILRATAAVIRQRVRETDLPARIGGEEFAVVLTGTDVGGATALAESLRADIANRVDLLGRDWPVSASFGVAALPPGGTVESLIGTADRAMYRAKELGRNRVCAADVASSQSQ